MSKIAEDTREQPSTGPAVADVAVSPRDKTAVKIKFFI
jgi:hypothetical protein